MSTQQGAMPDDYSGHAGQPGQPSEEEMRAAYEAELSRITTTDMIAQAAVSLLNIGAHRMGAGPAPGTGAGAGEAPGPGADQSAEDGRDLEQVRDAIDGARALLGILERRMPGELGPLRDALSRLQMAYAQEVKASGGEPQAPAGPGAPVAAGTPAGAGPAGTQGGPGGAQPAPGDAQPGPEKPVDPSGPGPAESSGRLWVPGR